MLLIGMVVLKLAYSISWVFALNDAVMKINFHGMGTFIQQSYAPPHHT
jgi:hypothetical protein